MEIEKLLEKILSDRSIPKSIKSSIEEAFQDNGTETPCEEKIHTIVSILSDVSIDSTISPTARTEIWSVLSELERITSRQ